MKNIIKLVPDLVGEGYKIDCDQILDEAKGKLSECIVIGIDEDGDIYVAASHNSGSANMLLDCGKRFLVDLAMGETE